MTTNTTLAISTSPIAGKGVFAKRPFKQGAVIFRIEGKHIRENDRRLSHRGFQQSRHAFIEPRRYSLGWYLNHSCQPNAYVDGDVIRARKMITRGTEITADYSLFTAYPTWDMPCGCGRTCRKLIVSYGKLPTTLKKANLKWTARYLKRDADRNNW